VKRKWLVIATSAAVLVAFIAGIVVFNDRSRQEAAQAASANGEALVRPHSAVWGNPAARVTIVEFFDPACGTCRAFYPIVKRMVNSSFGQIRLVVRYAPLHDGSDIAIKILEAARQQGKYWQALEKTLEGQAQWASHQNSRPELIWGLIGDIGLDLDKAKADAGSDALERLLQQDIADMKSLKVTKTPGFFVNGEPLRQFGEAQLKSLVEQKLREAGAP
jgi:protein-disulfide isomerase